MVLYQGNDSRLMCCLMVDRYRSVIVLPVWSHMNLIMSMSSIRLIVRATTIDLINSLSLCGNLDVPVYSPFRKINLLLNSGRDH
jgi:hypothetical protein